MGSTWPKQRGDEEQTHRHTYRKTKVRRTCALRETDRKLCVCVLCVILRETSLATHGRECLWWSISGCKHWNEGSVHQWHFLAHGPTKGFAVPMIWSIGILDVAVHMWAAHIHSGLHPFPTGTESGLGWDLGQVRSCQNLGSNLTRPVEPRGKVEKTGFVVVHTFNPRAAYKEAGRSGVQGKPRLFGVLEASQDYKRHCLGKKRETRQKTAQLPGSPSRKGSLPPPHTPLKCFYIIPSFPESFLGFSV